MPERIVIALGGNALQSGNSAPTAEAQLEVVKKTSERIAEISRRGYEMAVVHGNGPQVGRIVLAGEAARDVVPPMPFDVCGAMSQGYIGYDLQNALREELLALGRYLKTLTNMEKLEVLPYHSMGKVKYDSLGIEYPLLGTPQLSKAEAAQAEAIIREGMAE